MSTPDLSLSAGSAPPPALLADLPPELFAVADADHLPDLDDEWIPEDLDRANWSMARLAEEQAKLDEIDDYAVRWTRRINSWRDSERTGPAFWVEYFSARLKKWAIAERSRSGDRKATFALPSGKVATTKSKPKIAMVDADLVRAWVAENEIDPSTMGKVDFTPQITAIREQVEVVEWAVYAADGTLLLDTRVEVPEQGPCIAADDGQHYVGCGCDDIDPEPFAVDDGGAVLDHVTIVRGPHILHTVTGLLVPGLVLEPETVTASVKPSL